mgnify:CR=1 FL=1
MSAVDYSLQIDEARETAICEVRGLSKSYRNFWLNDVSFKLEPGYIMGFVGRNGAGKSTTIKSMLRLVKPDCGEVKMFGMDYAEDEEECKKHLGIILGEFDYYADKKLKTVTGVVRRFYPEWDEAAYRRCISRFGIGVKENEYSSHVSDKSRSTLYNGIIEIAKGYLDECLLFCKISGLIKSKGNSRINIGGCTIKKIG